MAEPMVSGFEWWTYPRGWLDVIRCMRGRHRKVFTAVIPGDDASPVHRCSCGATWLSLPTGGGWVPEASGGRKRRKGVAVAVGPTAWDFSAGARL